MDSGFASSSKTSAIRGSSLASIDNRIAKACSSCSRQKVKCDGLRPCSRCEIVGTASSCVYLPSLRGKIKKRRVESMSEYDPTGGSNAVTAIPSLRNTSNNHRQIWDQTHNPGFGSRNSVLWDKPVEPHLSASSPLSHSTATGPGLHASAGSATMDELTSTLPRPGDTHNPLSLMVELSTVDDRSDIVETGRTLRLAEERSENQYYAPLERVLKDEAPHIMGFINPHEAEALFEIYFRCLHPHLPVLDRDNSSPGVIARRSNFLFNAICCAAARTHNVVLWERLKDFARFELERLPIEKNMDVVQGHLIYTWWNLIPPKRFENDQTWLRAGLAYRTATDIALHRVAIFAAARQGLPPFLLKTIVRTWLLCFIVDRTLSIQLGKPSARQWEFEAWKYIEVLRGDLGHVIQPSVAGSSSTVDDIHVAALAEWALIMSSAVDSFRNQGLRSSSLPSSSGYSADLTTVFVDQLHRWRDSSVIRWQALSGNTADAALDIQLEVYERYAHLVIQSLALQHVSVYSPNVLHPCFVEYQSCALQLIETIERSERSMKTLQGAPDFFHHALAYGATSLLRCLQPAFSHLSPNRDRLFSSARKAAVILSAAAVGVDHIAAIQSTFVSKLIKTREAASLTSTENSNISGLNSLSSYTATGRDVEAADFAEFARTVNVDQSLTLWPPDTSGIDNGFLLSNWDILFSGVPLRARSNLGETEGIEANSLSQQTRPTGLSAWAAAQQDLGISGSNLGSGTGIFPHPGFELDP